MSEVNTTSYNTRDVNVNFVESCVDLPTTLSESDIDRFRVKVARPADAEACWLWLGSKLKRTGYGQMWVGSRAAHRTVYAHRVAWELAHGPVPRKLMVLHRCDVPSCVNPAHLFLGTHLDNMRDASRKGRLAVPRRRNRARIAEIQARWLAGGVTQRQLAEEYHTSKTQITRWLKAVKSRPYQRKAA